MARAGLGPNWACLFANDIDPKKTGAYSANWGEEPKIVERDVAKLDLAELPGTADLVWASFPCQDLSLAGLGAGLKGAKSGTFWPFWKLLLGLEQQKRNPAVVVLENVCGTLTSHQGRDFRSLISAMREGGYQAGALVIDAALFLPQSRPRLFVIGVRRDIQIDPTLISATPRDPFHTPAIVKAYENLSHCDQGNWIWWKLSPPSVRVKVLSDIVLENPGQWQSQQQTKALLRMMSPLNLSKVAAAKKIGRLMVGTVYKRTRPDEYGVRRQRAEVRFDEVAGCLRTPGGGSSRQTILLVEGQNVRSRLLSPREAARLMGVSEKYILPERYNDAYHLMGDGVAVPVVSHIASNILEPLLRRYSDSLSDSAIYSSKHHEEEVWRQISSSEEMRSRVSRTRSESTLFAI